MGIKTVPHCPYSPDLAPCDFWLFPKLRGYRYETIEEMKEAVTKVIDTLTQEDFDGALQKLLEWYNKCIAAGGDYFEGDKSFMCVLSIKVPIRKIWKLFEQTSYKENERLISKEGEGEEKRKKADIESIGVGSWPLSDLGETTCRSAGHRWMTTLVEDD